MKIIFSFFLIKSSIIYGKLAFHRHGTIEKKLKKNE